MPRLGLCECLLEKDADLSGELDILGASGTALATYIRQTGEVESSKGRCRCGGEECEKGRDVFGAIVNRRITVTCTV